MAKGYVYVTERQTMGAMIAQCSNKNGKIVQ